MADLAQGSAGESSSPAIRRALNILELLAQSGRGMSLSELSRKLGLPKSSTHRIMSALEGKGYVHKDIDSSRYHFGLKLVRLSRSALANLELRTVARPLLISLMRRTGLTVHMAVLESGQAVLVERIEAPTQIAIGTWIGRAMDVNSTAAGKALIAFLAGDEFERQFQSKTFVRHNHRTLVSMQALREDLVQIRKLGYAVDDEEDEIGTRCVGAPILNHTGQAVAAISVVGTTAQVPNHRIPQLGTIIQQFACGVAALLGSGQAP